MLGSRPDVRAGRPPLTKIGRFSLGAMANPHGADSGFEPGRPFCSDLTAAGVLFLLSYFLHMPGAPGECGRLLSPDAAFFCCGAREGWRSGQDSNLLPPAVLPVCFRKTPPDRAAATEAAELYFLCFFLYKCAFIENCYS